MEIHPYLQGLGSGFMNSSGLIFISSRGLRAQIRRLSKPLAIFANETDPESYHRLYV